MGSGPSSTTTQSGQTTSQPWATAIPYLQNILQQTGGVSTAPNKFQNSAVSQLVDEAQAVPGFGKQGSALASNLFGYNTNPQQSLLTSMYGGATGDITSGVNAANSMLGSNYATAGNTLNNAYNTASGALSPYLNANYTNPMNVPGFANTLNAIGQQTQQATDSLFAAAGRDPAGNAQAAKAAATATMNAEAPYLTNEYNALVGQQQGAGQYLGSLGANIGGTLGQLGLGTGGALGQLGISEGGTLGNLGIGTSGALTSQQLQGLGANYEGAQLAEALPGLYTTPATAQLQAANTYAMEPAANIAGLEGLINPIAGMGGTSINFGTGTTQGSQSMLGNLLGGALGASALFSAPAGGTSAATGIGNMFSSFLPMLGSI